MPVPGDEVRELAALHHLYHEITGEHLRGDLSDEEEAGKLASQVVVGLDYHTLRRHGGYGTRVLDPEQMIRLEEKIDRLLGLIDRFMPLIERFAPGSNGRVPMFTRGKKP
jgi:hypothetical protein